MSPRRAPAYVLGGSLHRAPNGDLATIQTTPLADPSPQAIRQVWASATNKRHPKGWTGVEPEGYLVIWWTPEPIRVTCGHCRRLIGRFVAYKADTEYGVVPKDAKRDRLTARRAAPSTDPRFALTGAVAGKAAKTIAHFICPRCRHHYERNLAKLGGKLWTDRPDTYTLQP